MKNSRIFIAAAVALAASQSFAQSATLSVNGTINPAACTIALTNATQKLGPYTQASFKAAATDAGTTYNLAAPSVVNHAVTCSGPQLIATRLTDSNPTFVAAAYQAQNAQYRFGLKNGSNSLGYTEFGVSGVDIDKKGASQTLLFSSNSGTTWVDNTGVGLEPKDYWVSRVLAASATRPAAVTTYKFDLTPVLSIDKAALSRQSNALIDFATGYTVDLVYP